MKKIVVFGATGNTGKYLIEYLKENLDFKKFSIVAVSRHVDESSKSINNVSYVRADISKKATLKKLDDVNIFAVINLAGAMPATMKTRNFQKYIDINITGTLNILEFCLRNKVDRIIYPTTEADLSGYWDKELVIRSDFERKFPLEGNYAPYIISKCAAVDLIKTYQNNYGIKAFIFRLPTIYLYKENPYYYVNFKKKKLGYRTLIDKAINGEEIEIWGDPNRVKDVVYVKDYCQLIYLALISTRCGGIYNVGTGKGISLEQQINEIVDVFSKDKESVIKKCPEKGNARQFIMDISKAKEELGYCPKYDYHDYLIDFKKEMQKHEKGKDFCN